MEGGRLNICDFSVFMHNNVLNDALVISQQKTTEKHLYLRTAKKTAL
jgi:hypothetical protein